MYRLHNKMILNIRELAESGPFTLKNGEVKIRLRKRREKAVFMCGLSV